MGELSTQLLRRKIVRLSDGRTVAGSSFQRQDKENSQMQKISPFLWFDNQAEEAANLYVSTFKNSKIMKITRYGKAGPSIRRV